MVHFKALLVFLCAMCLLSETLCSSSEAGDKVTIWCEFDESLANTIFWFKHTSDSVPLLIGCKKFRTSGPSVTCESFTENERIVMNVYKKNTSLTITAVTVSDTGLYYCGYGEEMISHKLSNSTSLHVKDHNKQNSEDKASDRNKTFSEEKATGLLSETLCFSRMESEAGVKITIWCEFNESLANTIFWFKHTSDSVPLLIGCQKFRTSGPSETCKSFTENERIVMNVYKKNTSLTITAVTVSDTGLYYCGYGEEMISHKLSNSTSLHVKDNNKQNSVDKASGRNINLCENKATGTIMNLSEVETTSSDSPAVFFLLIVGSGALIAVLLSVMIFNILQLRKTHTGAEAEANENEDFVLQSSSKKNKRHDEKLYTNIVYSPVECQ